MLDCLSGYLTVDAMLDGSLDPEVSSWNFGPVDSRTLTVGQVADLVAALWGHGARWKRDRGSHPPETEELTLDAGRAVRDLRWRPQLDAEEALRWTVSWAKATRDGRGARETTARQISDFEKRRCASDTAS